MDHVWMSGWKSANLTLLNSVDDARQTRIKLGLEDTSGPNQTLH